MNRSTVVAFVAVVATAWYGAAARAQPLLRHCVRQDALCWRCIDVVPPLSLPCPDRLSCAAPGVCVVQDLAANCYASRVRCCAATDSTCTIPDCAGAASGCSDVDGDGIYESCTSLTECPGAVASGLLDGGVPSVLDASVPTDGGGGIEDDAGELADATTARVDASTVASADAGTPTAMDGGATPEPPPGSFGFQGGGGCSCTTAPRSRHRDAIGAALVGGALGLVGARARRRRRSMPAS